MSYNMIVITGPTATGKTALGVAVAKALNGEVIGADSMQLYKRMDFGTAKPTSAEMDGVPHHMIGIVDPEEDYSVSLYVEQATAIADDIIARGKVPVVVGGTGLYIDSLIAGRNFADSQTDDHLREMLEQQYDAHGGEAMRALLRSFDPERASKLHPSDKRRIVRAIEVFMLSGMTISEHDRQTQKKPNRYNALQFALEFEDRQDLYNRINLRVDRMEVLGLFEEVHELLSSGLADDSTAMQAIGYKEAALALRDKLSREEAIELIKLHSRQYAKRQLTWLRRKDDITWIRWKKAPDLLNGVYTIQTAWENAQQGT